MKKIITISREYGSGGHTIGELLAKELGYSFYDSEIIDMTAQKSGFSPDFVRTTEQNLSSGWLYSLLLGSTYASQPSVGVAGSVGTVPTLPLADQVFNAQRRVIVELAQKGPCVIVGRCSDYILRHEDWVSKQELLNIFIYAPLADKVARAIEQKGLDPKTAEEFGLKDKQVVSVKTGKDGRELIFGDVVVRVSPRFAPAMHIDTDESNAACGPVEGDILV